MRTAGVGKTGCIKDAFMSRDTAGSVARYKSSSSPIRGSGEPHGRSDVKDSPESFQGPRSPPRGPLEGSRRETGRSGHGTFDGEERPRLCASAAEDARVKDIVTHCTVSAPGTRLPPRSVLA